MIDPILEYRYVQLLGMELEGFHRVRENIYNFRCPICGDSYYQKQKKRGYLIRKDEGFYFYCHNCGTSLRFRDFLEQVNPELYQNYRRESAFSSSMRFDRDDSKLFKDVKGFQIRDSLRSIASLPEKHKGRLYLENRKVSESVFPYVYWTDDFPKLITDSMGDKYKDRFLPMEGIVYPLRELSGEVTGYQIRSINPEISKARRFVTCSINEEHGYFYKEIDYACPIYVVEGCTDSLFLKNSIAICSSTLWKIHPSDKAVYFNDNEPRNRDVCKQIEKCISKGYKVVLLPDEYEGMDVNDLIIKAGLGIEDLDSLFKKYTYHGLSAKLQFAKWRK